MGVESQSLVWSFISVSVWTTWDTRRSQLSALLSWTTLPFCHRRDIQDFQTSRHLGRPEETLHAAAARVQYMYLFLYNQGENSTQIKQTQKKASHGTSCLMQESLACQ